MDQVRLLESLRRAVARQPDDETLRMHLAKLLVEAGHGSEAVAHIGLLLASDPTNPELQSLMTQALGGPGPSETFGGQAPPSMSTPGDAVENQQSADGQPGFDWRAAEADLIGGLAHEPVERRLRLSDVGGLAAVKERIESTFLLPMRNPQLRSRYGKSLRGGLLLYGPPGCGKTYVARAVAGELGAKFITVSLSEILSRWVGQSEANISEVFNYARAQAPCVVFFDEIDALGHKRSGLGHSGAALRGAVNQLLTELDGIGPGNEGVFVLAATNAPWDVDVAMRRPGRFDRAVFVEPPDETARAEILSNHLSGMPVDQTVDFLALARSTEGFSGADLEHVCQTAAEMALADAARNPGSQRDITAEDLRAAIAGITPSTGRWFDAARNVVLFADAAGEYTPLAMYMKIHRLL